MFSYRFYCFIFLILISSSCSNNDSVFEKIEINRIPALDQETVDPEDLFDIKTIIPLDFCDDCIIGEIHKILVDDSGIYVLDKNIVKSLKKFDFDGKLIYSINESGDGLGKYVLPFDFELVEDEVVILDVNQRKVLFFDSELGLFEKEERFGAFQAVSFAFVGNDNFAFHLDGRDFGSGKHFLGHITGLSSNFTAANWVYDFGNTDYMTVVQEFSRGLKGLLFSKSMNDTIYQVDEKGFHPKYFLDFGKKGLSDDIRNADIFEAREKIMTDWPYFHWGRVFENLDKVFFLWSGNQGEKKLSFYDKNLKKTFNLKGEVYFPNNIIYLDGTRLITYITPEEYMENDIPYIKKEYRNPVIVSFMIKKGEK